MEDKRNVLKEKEPFSCRIIKDNKAQIFFHGKMIKILQGKEFAKLERVMSLGDSYELQLFLAKITGQFKHGNEKNIQKDVI